MDVKMQIKSVCSGSRVVPVDLCVCVTLQTGAAAL